MFITIRLIILLTLLFTINRLYCTFKEYKNDERGQAIINKASYIVTCALNLGLVIIFALLYCFEMDNQDFSTIIISFILILDLTFYLSIKYLEYKM